MIYRYPKASTLEQLLIDGWTHKFSVNQTLSEIKQNGFSGTGQEIQTYWKFLDKKYEQAVQQKNEDFYL